jgi:hypothetical protein
VATVQSAFGLTEPAHAQLSQLKLHLLEMGPQITAYMKDHFSEDAGLYAYKVALVLIALGIGLSFFVKNKKAQ